jgi:hypothetical protein
MTSLPVHGALLMVAGLLLLVVWAADALLRDVDAWPGRPAGDDLTIVVVDRAV